MVIFLKVGVSEKKQKNKVKHQRIWSTKHHFEHLQDALEAFKGCHWTFLVKRCYTIEPVEQKTTQTSVFKDLQILVYAALCQNINHIYVVSTKDTYIPFTGMAECLTKMASHIPRTLDCGFKKIQIHGEGRYKNIRTIFGQSHFCMEFHLVNSCMFKQSSFCKPPEHYMQQITTKFNHKDSAATVIFFYDVSFNHLS